MGAADFNTGATISGKTEDILAAVKVMRDYTTVKLTQYREKRNCPYLQSCRIDHKNSEGLGKRIEEFTDDELIKFITDHNNEIMVNASGPYGVFGLLSEVDLFHEMAEAAPNATISGGMGGFGTGGEMFASFELKDGLMTCKYHEGEDFDEDFDDDEDWDDEVDFEEWDEDAEPDWDEIVIYDPVAKKNVKK